MSTQPYSIAHSALVDHGEWVRAALVPELPNSGPQFLPVTTLKERFTHHTITSLLNAVLPETSWSKRVLPRTIRDKGARLFCILLRISEGEWIERFLQQGITDMSLPLLDKGQQWPANANFFHKFHDAQWQYAPPVLTPDMSHFQLRSEHILPFTQRRPLAESDHGGAATIDVVRIHPDFHELHSYGASHAVST